MSIKDMLMGFITQQELLNYYNTSISYEDLPEGVDGFVFDYKGINNIIVKKSLSYYKKKKTILHELAHIELCQLDQANKDTLSLCMNKIEDVADVYIKNILKEIKN